MNRWLKFKPTKVSLNSLNSVLELQQKNEQFLYSRRPPIAVLSNNSIEEDVTQEIEGDVTEGDIKEGEEKEEKEEMAEKEEEPKEKTK